MANPVVTSRIVPGQRFGFLTTVEPAPKQRRRRNHAWICRCDCGVIVERQPSALLSGKCHSCGCSRWDGVARRTHNLCKSPEYSVWAGMLSRCHNPRASGYEKYGGRGIFVCEEWRQSFARFYTDMGPRPTPQHSIDRVDNAGPYCQSNCRWATTTEQRRNSRRTVYLTHDGRTMLISDWAKEKGIKFATLWMRIERGWPVDAALTLPVSTTAKPFKRR